MPSLMKFYSLVLQFVCSDCSHLFFRFSLPLCVCIILSFSPSTHVFICCTVWFVSQLARSGGCPRRSSESSQQEGEPNPTGEVTVYMQSRTWRHTIHPEEDRVDCVMNRSYAATSLRLNW